MIPALVNHLWQSTLFALGAGLLTLMVRRNGAALRYGLWFAASMKFLIPFALLTAAGGLAVDRLHLSLPQPRDLQAIAPMVAPFPAAPTARVATPPTAAEQPTPAVASRAEPPRRAGAPVDPAPILFGVWALGLAAVLLVWSRRWSAVRAALNAARPSRLPAPVPVLSTPFPMEPGVVGLRRPVLIVPDGIAEHLSPAEWKAVLAHELCHIRRRDNLTSAIHMLVQALFWFHPLVWWLGVRLVAEREQACDEAVVRGGANARTYAEGILKVCRLYVQQPLACAAGVSGADLKQRVSRILSGAASRRLGAAKKVVLAAAAVLAVAGPLSAGLFAGAPRLAHAQVAHAPLPLPLAQVTKPVVADATKSKPEDGERAAPLVQTDTSTPAPPELAKAIVLAAIETALSPVPDVAPADVRERQVVANLSQTTPELPALDVAATSQPIGDWGILESLAGKDYSGDVSGGVGIIRFRKGANNTYSMIYGMIGEKGTEVALKLVAKNRAVMLHLSGRILAGPGLDPSFSVYLKQDGLIIDWGRSTCGNLGYPGCFFSKLINASGVGVTTLTLADGQLIENQQSDNGGRVVFRPFSGIRPAASRGPESDLAIPAQQAQSAPSGASGGAAMTRPKLIPAVFAAATLASSAAAAPTVYVPPGDTPRFGGDFTLTDVGPVAGFWRTECYNWHVRSQSRRTGPFAAPPVDETIKRFVSSLIVEKPDYNDLSPAMADAVRKSLPTTWPSLNRMGRATVAKLVDTDKDGNQLYVVDQRGGGSHWNMIINPEGKIASAFMCGGQGL